MIKKFQGMFFVFLLLIIPFVSAEPPLTLAVYSTDEATVAVDYTVILREEQGIEIQAIGKGQVFENVNSWDAEEKFILAFKNSHVKILSNSQLRESHSDFVEATKKSLDDLDLSYEFVDVSQIQSSDLNVLFEGSSDTSFEADFTGTLSEGETQTFHDTQFEIVNSYVASTPTGVEVKFSVNGVISDSLSEGETQTLIAPSECVTGSDKEITAAYISEDEAKLSVDGALTPTIAEGETYLLENIEVTLISIVNNEAKWSVNGVITPSLKEGEGTLIEGVDCTSGQSYELTVLFIDGDVVKISLDGNVLTFTEGETKYSINGDEITLVYHSEEGIVSSGTRFTVNGEVTDLLRVDEITKLKDGSQLQIREIEDDSVHFAFDVAVSSMTDSERETVIQDELQETTHDDDSGREEQTDNEVDDVIKINADDDSSLIQTTCQGCQLDDVCVPFGSRLEQNSAVFYCALSGELELQKEKGVSCQNSYECMTNECSDGVCSSLSEELAETRGLFQKIMSWFSSIF